MMENMLYTHPGFVIDDELRSELERGVRADDDPAIHVYLCSGAVQEVRPASAVSVTDDRVVLLYHDLPVASFRRSTVYLCSKSAVSPGPF